MAKTITTCALADIGGVLQPEWVISEYIKSGDLVQLLPEYDFAVTRKT
ncbi:hypothetical protein LU293_01020 [Moraxella nasovis]|nr:hypothetical protein [Moraxella nasovis]UNU73527.1 hypothetical protein LU293_01020 [Moraxella nasovis]